MKRREFLQFSGALAAQSLLASGLLQTLFIQNSLGQAVSVKSLQDALSPQDGLVLVPESSDFQKYQWAYNRRTMLTPLVRVLCKTPKAVSESLNWAQANDVPLAMRCGGHSYEGFSQSQGLVIDLRLMNQIEVSQDRQLVQVGGGGLLGQVYESLAPHKLVIPAGTCPTVGISGHTTGGGYGLSARNFGLACDSLMEAEYVDAGGTIRTASSTQDFDFLWASRGGGGGSFGVITKLTYKTHSLANVIAFGMEWTVNVSVAVSIMQAWLQWAPNLPNTITSLLSVTKNQDGSINLKCKGQSAGSMAELDSALKKMQTVKKAENVRTKAMTFIDGAHYFAGGAEGEPKFRKVKCDYIKNSISDDGLKTLLTEYPAGKVSVTLDSYGGTINDKTSADGAFAHRKGTLCSLKYSSNWDKAADNNARIALIRKFHDSMKPFVSGSSYINYCDTDIKDFGTAYWGDNFARLQQIKKALDPRNVFQHAQSIPVK